MAGHTLGTFKFRPNDNIGNLDAALDHDNLKECFVDPGALDILQNCAAPQRILLGRTGSGKTALLFKIAETQENVIEFNPEVLSLNYISNSTLLPVLYDLGVNLNLFFDLLWRHTLAIELIRKKYGISGESQYKRILENLTERFERDKSKAKALAYLRQWEDKFWLEADERAKNLTDRLERAITVNLGPPAYNIASLRLEAARSKEARDELVSRCQQVVNKVHGANMRGIIDLLSACFDDEKQRYYILIDRLDDNWVDESYKVPLIRALLSCVKLLCSIRSIKVIVALRYDLLNRVFEDGNFTAQREKYESLFYGLKWTKHSLIEAVDERTNRLVMSRYSPNRMVTHKDILASNIGRSGRGPSAIEYMINRTLLRPRDLISFFNICIKDAGSLPSITADVIRRAELEYSRGRLDALGWEWASYYPTLIPICKMLFASQPSHFVVASITEASCISLIEYTRSASKEGDPITRAAEDYNTSGDCLSFKRRILSIFYEVGLIGLKLSKAMPWEFATSGLARLSEHEISESTRIAIHACFWRALGVRDNEEAYV